MGVKGLTTFLKENRSISRTLNLDAKSAKSRDRIPIIIDAWGLIYRLHQGSLPWTGGGEYLAFYRIARRLIGAWRNVGLDMVFVFDGAPPPEKHDTIISRLNDNIHNTQLFYATSPASRSSPSFSRSTSNAILPPFCSHVFVQAIHDAGATSHFVPIGEADGVCAVLADRLGGYVMGQDSDFVILMGEGGRGRGYVPFDMMSWYPGEVEDTVNTTNPAEESQEGAEEFTRVSNPKQDRSRRTRESPLLPPSEFSNPILNLVIYPPSALRTRLRLPATVLPLFASLCGTDYTPPQAAYHFFEPTLNLVQRIEKVARILREQLFNPNVPKSGTAGDHAADLVERVVKKLTVREFYTTSERGALVDSIVEATLQYTLPTLGRCCEYHPFCGFLDDTGCQSESPSGVEEGVKRVAAAHTKGEFRAARQAYLYPDTIHVSQVLEDPGRVGVKAKGLKEVRKGAWEIVDEVLGLRFPIPEVGLDIAPEEDGAKELGGAEIDSQRMESTQSNGVTGSPMEEEMTIDGSEVTLVESFDKSEEQDKNDDDIPTNQIEVDVELPSDSKIIPEVRTVTEYIRCSNRIQPQTVTLNSPSSTKRALEPLKTRYTTYLQYLQSNTSLIQALPLAYQPIVAILRFCIIDQYSPPLNKEGWRSTELTAVLQACLGTYSQWLREARGDVASKKELEVSYPKLEARNCQLVAGIQGVMTDSVTLAEALLIQTADHSSPEATHLQVYKFYSGQTLHSFLNKLKPEAWKWNEGDQAVFETCLAAIVDGIEDKIVGWTIPQDQEINPVTKTTTIDVDEPAQPRPVNIVDPVAPVDHFEGMEKGGKKRKNKSKSGKNKKSGGGGGGGVGGRFDLLNGLID